MWCCANLISLEEHALSSWARTGDDSFLEKLRLFRERRTRVMKGILGARAGEQKAEIWCMFKHLLSASMRAFESGNRYEGKEARHFYEISRDLFGEAIGLAVKYGANGTGIETSIETEKPANENHDDGQHGIKENVSAPTRDLISDKISPASLWNIIKCCL